MSTAEATREVSRSFAATLIGDVVAAEARLAADGDEAARRDLVRTRYAAIEGMVWIMREHVHGALSQMKCLTPLADLALRERSYVVTDHGVVKERVQFTPLTQAIRMIVDQARRASPDLQVAFHDAGWQMLQDAASIRNRVMHPKAVDDLTISPDDIATVRRGMAWLLATVEYVTARTSLSFKLFSDGMETLLAQLRAGEPAAVGRIQPAAQPRAGRVAITTSRAPAYTSPGSPPPPDTPPASSCEYP